MVISEAVRHSADEWRNPENPSVTVFYAYKPINVRHHKPTVPREVPDGLAPERCRFFNEVYHPQFDRRGG